MIRRGTRWQIAVVVPARRALLSDARAIRRSDIGCRSTRCPGWRQLTIRTSTSTATRRQRPFAPLPRRRAAAAVAAGRCYARQPALDRGQSAAWITRTAMCAEPREGVLYVFMPPVDAARGLPRAGRGASKTPRGAWACRSCSRATTPPRDPRLEEFRVTPDPGVIEVNIHPARSWEELVERTTVLYEAARASPAELRRSSCSTAGTRAPAAAITSSWVGRRRRTSPSCAVPTCCAACSRYWHNHPSLSYLFSGMFLGPTCQAPRIDEARNDSPLRARDRFPAGTRPDGPVPPGSSTDCSVIC